MKAVLLSIRPEWCGVITIGKKTNEVRKTRPKLETPFKCFIYCTKNGLPLYLNPKRKNFNDRYLANGKVIGEFICDDIYDIIVGEDGDGHWWHETIGEECDEKQMCLTWDEVTAYLGHAHGYGWHISDLVIYDTPREIWEFWKPCPYNGDCTICGNFSSVQFGDGTGFSFCKDEQNRRLSRPPQSWCYVV